MWVEVILSYKDGIVGSPGLGSLGKKSHCIESHWDWQGLEGQLVPTSRLGASAAQFRGLAVDITKIWLSNGLSILLEVSQTNPTPLWFSFPWAKWMWTERCDTWLPTTQHSFYGFPFTVW